MTASRARKNARLPLGSPLSIAQVLAGARAPVSLALAPGAARRIDASAQRIQRAVSRSEWVYGVTTGFGSNAVASIPAADIRPLQVNLLLSHACGVGPPFPDEVVRLALLLRIHALAWGHSGVRRRTLTTLMALYEKDLLPVVPCRGSVGASGDLAPLAHLALPLIGQGRIRRNGREEPAQKALSRAGIPPLVLEAKEGLALINGMQVTLSLLLLALERAERLVRAADLSAALTMEALAARSDALDARLHAARHHPGQQESAARLRAILEKSELIDAPFDRLPGKRRAPQDAYSVRCAPQVHGAAADGIGHVRAVLAREVNAATDNPLVFGDAILSGGNFHGEPLALVADHLRLCVHELGSISERRIATLVDPHMNEGLPAYLAPQAGLHSGFMIPQYVAAALVSETKGLCVPAAADSIPTGANIEDHVSMAPIGARRTLEVLDLVEEVLAIEFLAAAQAVDIRPLKPAPATARAIARLRRRVPFRAQDGPWENAVAEARSVLLDLADALVSPALPSRTGAKRSQGRR